MAVPASPIPGSSCPEFEFDSCYWHFISFQNDGRSFFETNANYAHDAFNAHAENFSPAIEQLLEVHRLVQPLRAHLPQRKAPCCPASRGASCKGVHHTNDARLDRVPLHADL